MGDIPASLVMHPADKAIKEQSKNYLRQICFETLPHSETISMRKKSALYTCVQKKRNNAQ